jgi:uncharacterized protein YlxP (DUF503 family)
MGSIIYTLVIKILQREVLSISSEALHEVWQRTTIGCVSINYKYQVEYTKFWFIFLTDAAAAAAHRQRLGEMIRTASA